MAKPQLATVVQPRFDGLAQPISLMVSGSLARPCVWWERSVCLGYVSSHKDLVEIMN